MQVNNRRKAKAKVILDLLGVISQEGMFATKIVYPLIEDVISYDLFKKKYLLYSLGIITEYEFWEHITSSKEKISKIERKILKETYITPNVYNVCNQILKQGNNLYLASEIPKKWGELIIEKAGLKDWFTKKFYSSDLKVTKPFRGFYDRVFNPLIEENKKIYYIDDTAINLKVAFMYGVKTIYFDSKMSKPSRGIFINYTARKMEDILEILCKE